MLGECDKCYVCVLPLTLIGLAYSLYASALWPMIPYVVKPQVVGTGYGMATAVQNIGLSFIPNLIGLIQDSTDGYAYVELSLSGIVTCGILTSYLLMFLDHRINSSILQTPTAKIPKPKPQNPL